jgi:hypothetical protein
MKDDASHQEDDFTFEAGAWLNEVQLEDTSILLYIQCIGTEPTGVVDANDRGWLAAEKNTPLAD